MFSQNTSNSTHTHTLTLFVTTFTDRCRHTHMDAHAHAHTHMNRHIQTDRPTHTHAHMDRHMCWRTPKPHIQTHLHPNEWWEEMTGPLALVTLSSKLSANPRSLRIPSFITLTLQSTPFVSPSLWSTVLHSQMHSHQVSDS